MNAIRWRALALIATVSLTGSFVYGESPARESNAIGKQDLNPDITRPSKFLRLALDQNGIPKSLQTSITRFESADGRVLVDLVGAVHIGEWNYYKRINRQLSQYEVVLYELVAPQGTRVPSGGQRDTGMNPLAWLQDSSKRMLGLESQLELIDYQRDNFVHADLSPSEISEKMAERGETPLSVGLSALSEMMRQQSLAAQKMKADPDSVAAGPSSLQELLELMGNPLELKRMMATQFTSSGSIEMGLGETLNQLLVVDRNKAALRVLKKQLNDDKTKIAIFYGAAHMPDFEKRLRREFDLTKTKHVWVDAWDLTRAPEARNDFSDPATLLMKMLESLGN